jgi:hypothetical protein
VVWRVCAEVLRGRYCRVRERARGDGGAGEGAVWGGVRGIFLTALLREPGDGEMVDSRGPIECADTES